MIKLSTNGIWNDDARCNSLNSMRVEEKKKKKNVLNDDLH